MDLDFNTFSFILGNVSGVAMASIVAFFATTNMRFLMDNLDMDLRIERDHSNFLEDALTNLTMEQETTRGKRK